MNEIFSFETLSNSSYLVATFPGGSGIINYQLQMLTNNEIKNIIKANKRQKNEDILVSYNITSKISLEQATSKGKITKAGLINIIEGAIAAFEDISEYQLVNSGIVFDEKYIFIKPGTYEPSFIYLPCYMEDVGGESIKKFLISLIVGSKVEITNDSFVQTLLDTLNKPAFSVNDLKKLCNEFKMSKATQTKKQESVQQPVVTPVNPIVQTPSPQTGMPTPEKPVQQPERPSAPPIGMRPIPEVKKSKEKDKPQKEEFTKKKSKMPLFFVLQIVLLGAIAAIFLSGALNNEDGTLNTTYLFGVALIAVAIDFVLYREMFINNKNKDNKQKKENKKVSGAPKKEAKTPPMSMTGRSIPSKPAIPGKEPPKPSVNPPMRNIPQKPEQSVQRIEQKPVQVPVAPPVPQPVYTAPSPTTQYGQVSDFESEDTVVLDDNSSEGAYLEFFDNGLMTKIKLNKESILVGKLRGQCDFVINNNKISRMHAEFITRGNEYFVKDYNSMNGTYINGSSQRITNNVEYQIFNGDRITLANVDMTFRC